MKNSEMPEIVEIKEGDNLDVQNSRQFEETIEFETPNGGAYATAFYYDRNRRPCPKEKAKYCNIVEYDKEGRRINESYGVMK